MADFQQQPSPVLSLASIAGPVPEEPGISHPAASHSDVRLPVSLAFSGSTSGDVAVWDLAPWAAGPSQKPGAPRQGGGPVPQGPTGAGAAANDGLPCVTPLLVVEGAHQSGVNCLSVSFQGSFSTACPPLQQILTPACHILLPLFFISHCNCRVVSFQASSCLSSTLETSAATAG